MRHYNTARTRSYRQEQLQTVEMNREMKIEYEEEEIEPDYDDYNEDDAMEDYLGDN